MAQKSVVTEGKKRMTRTWMAQEGRWMRRELRRELPRGGWGACLSERAGLVTLGLDWNVDGPGG